jgi:hypothetical protein
MDVMLGVSVTDTDARIALLDAAPPHDAIDQSGVDLTGESLDALVSTLVSTDRMLAESGHRVVATRVCGTDAEQTGTLVDALVDADLSDVTAVAPSDAVTAAVRSLAAGQTVASLSSEGDTAALSIIDSETDTASLIAVEAINRDDHGSAYRALLERFGEEPGGATSVIVLGAPMAAQWAAEMSRASAVPLRFPDEPEFVVARGAALAGLLQPSTVAASGPDVTLDSADTVLGAQGPQLAYSAVEDTGGFGSEYEYGAADVPMQTPMRPLSATDPEEVETDDVAPAGPRPKMLLVGSTVAAIVVVGFAALAVSVAISIRPTATQNAIRMQQEIVPGKYFPVTPGQGVVPDGPNWTAVENVPPPGVDTGGVRTFETKALNFSGGGADVVAPKVIQIYRDGTVGLPDPQSLVSVPPVPPDAFNPDVAPPIPDLVPRLIPDLSKVNMNQVLTVLGNLQEKTASPLDSTASKTLVPLDQLGSPNTGLGLTDLGVTTVVAKNRGALFNTDETRSAAPGVGSIPAEIFQPGKTGVDVTQALPPDTRVIEALPAQVDNGKPGSKPTFGGVITDLDAITAKPGIAPPGAAKPEPGSVPTVITESVPDISPKTGVTQQLPGFPLPNLAPNPVVPQQSPGTITPPELSPVTPDVPVQSPVTPPKSDSTTPFPNLLPWPKVTPQKPDVSPPQQVPEVASPAKVDPPVSDPEPVVKAPTPIFNLPIPSFHVPVPVAPVAPVAPSVPAEEAPSAPAAPVVPQIPLLPQLPVVGGLFGSN